MIVYQTFHCVLLCIAVMKTTVAMSSHRQTMKIALKTLSLLRTSWTERHGRINQHRRHICCSHQNSKNITAHTNTCAVHREEYITVTQRPTTDDMFWLRKFTKRTIMLLDASGSMIQTTTANTSKYIDACSCIQSSEIHK